MPNNIWKNHDYLRLLTAQVVSLIGTGISSICLALLAYDLAGEDASMALTITFSIKMLTYIFLAPAFSAISHRFPKRQTLVTLDIIRALIFIFIPFVTNMWEVYLLMFIVNACSAWFTPQFQSILPLIFSTREEYTKALSLSRLAFDLELMISPVLTALLLTTMTFRSLLVLDAGTFIVSGVLILLCGFANITTISTTPVSLTFYELSKGIRDYLNKPELKALWLAYLAVSSASAMVLISTVTYVHEILNGGEKQTALAMMIVGFGSMLIALNLPRWLQTNMPQRFHWIGMISICGALTMGIFTPGWIGYIVICLLLGIGMSCIQTTSGLIITQVGEDEDCSKYFSAHFSLTHFWWLIAYLVAGTSVTLLGISYAYLCMGILSILSMTTYYFVIKKHDE